MYCGIESLIIIRGWQGLPSGGLAAAYKLKVHGLDVTVFEADGRTGGKLRSISQDGLIWDEGANTMTESDVDVSRLLDDLGLRDKQLFVSDFV
ncbi:protoporphyrinogen oxidase, mitochondrial [Tanacetum coccineum]